MKLTVLFGFLAYMLSTVDGLPWSAIDPMLPALKDFHKNTKERNLAKITLLPQTSISFVGPRQLGNANSVEESEYDDYAYDDDDYTNSEEAEAYPWD